MNKGIKDTILLIVMFTLATWFSILLLSFIGADFEYGVFITMLIALTGYSVVFTGVSAIVAIVYWLKSKLK